MPAAATSRNKLINRTVNFCDRIALQRTSLRYRQPCNTSPRNECEIFLTFYRYTNKYVQDHTFGN